jgi:ribonuclease HI
MSVAVIYTDGSILKVNENKNYNGWGVHIYYGEISGKIRKVGYGDWVYTSNGYMLKKELKVADKLMIPEQIIDLAHTGVRDVNDSPVIEVMAFIGSVNFLIKRGIDGLSEIMVLTDSEAVYKLYFAVKNDKHSNFGDKNPHLKQSIVKLLSVMSEKNIKLSVKKVTSHSDEIGNNHADLLAKLGRLGVFENKGLNVFDYKPTDFWKPEKKMHPLLTKGNVYFTINDRNTDNVYKYNVLTFKDRDKEDPSKKSNGLAYSYIESSEPDELIDGVKNIFTANKENISKLSVIRVDKLFTSDNYRVLSAYGTNALTFTDNSREAMTVNGYNDVVCETLKIPARAFNVIDNFLLLKQYLAEYKNHKVDDANREVISIKDKIYDLDDNGVVKDLKKSITNQTTSIDLDYTSASGETGKIIMELKNDLPDRNHLKKLAPLNPTVDVFVRHVSEKHIKVYAIVKIEMAISIWVNFYTNSVYLK